MKKYLVIDAFSGAGGLSLGLQKAGLDVLFSFDNDALSVKTQQSNRKYFGHDVYKEGIDELLKGRTLEDRLGNNKGKIFLVAGGPPCQGFSVQRIGKDADPRNDLVLKYATLITRVRPMFFLMENVPGLKGKRGQPILAAFLEKMRKVGYIPYLQILNAEDFGVPQRRKRVLVVGVRSDVHKKKFEFPLPRKTGEVRTVRSAIGDLPPPPDDGSDHPQIPHHRRDKLSALNLARLKALRPGQGRESLPTKLLADCHKFGAEKIGHRSVYGRMDWDHVSPTITARFDSFTRGQFGHPDQNRSITLREGALLQTFPRDFCFSGNKVDIARQIGNAVPPMMAKAIGAQIIKYYTSRS